MDITDMITIGLTVIGGATLIFRGLLILSKFTKTEKDDNFFQKVLDALTTISGMIALNNEAKSKVKVTIKR